jgi:hypothetical protein
MWNVYYYKRYTILLWLLLLINWRLITLYNTISPLLDPVINDVPFSPKLNNSNYEIPAYNLSLSFTGPKCFK